MSVQLETVIEEVRRRGKATANSLLGLQESESASAGYRVEPNYRRLRRVLIIEDSQDLSAALARRLEHAGFEAACAYDGLAGVEMIQNADPDLVLLDLGLPCLSGFKLLHRLRSAPLLGDAPILILTGDADPSIDARAAVYGVERVLRKPARPRHVVDVIKDVLRGLD